MVEKIQGKILGLALIVSLILVFVPFASSFFTAKISNVSVFVSDSQTDQPTGSSSGSAGGRILPVVGNTVVTPEKKPPINTNTTPSNNTVPQATQPEQGSQPSIISFLPLAVADLTQKIPDFGAILSKLNISNAEDVASLNNYNIFLPGLKKIGDNKIPTEIVFVQLANRKIDALIKLDFSNSDVVAQKINVFPGESMHLILKPKARAKAVSGYIIFKSYNPKVAFTGRYIPSFNMALSALSGSDITSSHIVKNSTKITSELDQQFTVLNFNYNDDDKDGIYTADIKAPVAKGEYEVVSSIDYGGAVENKKDIKFTTLIDPEGYIYEKSGDKELRINNAVVSLYRFNNDKYELWSAGEFGQENPQITDTTGNYAFLVPAGTYYITVSVPNYYFFQGDAFSVAEGKEIHANIALKKEFDLSALINWNTVLIFILFCLVAYNFFRDAKRV